MGWNSKTDVIVMLLICGGPALITLFVPIIAGIKHGRIALPLALILLICLGIYLHKKNKKTERND